MRIERQLQGNLNTIFTEEIKSRNLENRISPYVTIEEGRADITLKNSRGKPILFIELKDPTANDGKSIFDSNVLMRELERSQKLEIDYFGNCNFLATCLFDTKKMYDKNVVYQGELFTLLEIARLSINYVLTSEMLRKLRSIVNFYIDRAIEIIERKAIKFTPIDELFIFKIRELIAFYAFGIADKVWEKYNKDKKFEKEISAYAEKQQWSKPTTFEEISNITYISILMLVSKLIFYKTFYDNDTWRGLSPITIDKNIKSAKKLEERIWEYFQEFQEITGDFELLIGIRDDIIFRIPFVSDNIIELVNSVVNAESHYNFSKAKYDVIGRIFEELIREDERHKLGQYFTPSHVIDVINAFAIRTGSEKVFDPSCGSGTFLVRAYERKKTLEKKLHSKLLDEIYGNDVSDYPAYLSMLNLAIRNIEKYSYPRITNRDFFDIYGHSKVDFLNSKGEKEKKLLPKFDAIIGNPPYTRQEEIGSLQGLVSKDIIKKIVESDCGITPSQRTSIYAYFFYHSFVFLKEGGYLAFLVQNSWMDTDYGVDLQKYFLENYEIIAIIDSEVERFFPSASVNTSIVILRKSKYEEKRNINIVKFIYLKSKLSDVLKEFKNPDKLVSFIEKEKISTENKLFKLTCVVQSELCDENKWSIYLKAPKVYFDIIKKGKNKFIPLNKKADVKFGIKTGCNEFFIVTDVTKKIKETMFNTIVNNTENIVILDEILENELCIIRNGYNELWLIEKKFLKPMLASPKEVNKYKLISNDIKNSVILINERPQHLKDTYAWKYILYGKKKGINTRETCASRDLWYNLGDRELPNMSFNYMINDFGKTFLGKFFTNNNFHNIYIRKNTKSIWYFLNSTISWFIQQLTIRSNMGDGVGKIETYELSNFPVLDIDLENLEIDLGETKNYKEELGSLSDLSTVNPQRVKLDSEIMKAIGFTNKKEREEVLMEMYRATVQMIESRFAKAQSLNSVKKQRNKIEFTAYTEHLKQLILDEKIQPNNNIKFFKAIQKLVKKLTADSRLQNKILESYWKDTYNESCDEKAIAQKDQTNLF
jgi:type I restriction-modification system DNA methylase subunit